MKTDWALSIIPVANSLGLPAHISPRISLSIFMVISEVKQSSPLP